MAKETNFSRDNDDEIIFNVINHTIDFNLLPKISMECREVLTSMLERDPTKRISANELLQHSWIKVCSNFIKTKYMKDLYTLARDPKTTRAYT